MLYFVGAAMLAGWTRVGAYVASQVAKTTGKDARVVVLDLPAEAQQQLEAQKGNLGAAQVPKGLSGETAAAVQKARDNSMPKDNIQRAIDRGTGAGGQPRDERIRAGERPSRVDRCLAPGKPNKPIDCPRA